MPSRRIPRNNRIEILAYFRDLLQVDRMQSTLPFHRSLRRRKVLISRLLDRELPAILDVSDEREEHALCSLLHEFFSGHWPREHCGSMQSYAAGPSHAVPYHGDQVLFTWSTDGQYFVRRSKDDREYFIHRDLQTFLQREMLLFLAFRAGESVSSDIRRRFTLVCQRIFSVLVGVETDLKRLFEAPASMSDPAYCVSLGKIPRDLYPQVMRNRKQKDEWRMLYGTVPLRGKGDSFCGDHPALVVDTRHFPPSFVRDMREAGVVDDASLDGTLIKGDNLHTLRMLSPDLHNSVRCIYLDPPYNTGGKGFLYHDAYAQDAWLTMMDNRLELAKGFLSDDGSIFVQIDYNQKECLRFLLDRYFSYQTEIIWRIGWISGFKSAGRKFIRNHDTIYHYSRSRTPFFRKNYIPYPPGYVRRDGQPPKGKGYPLEDTWNCSDIDRLDSIQIKSFSREKVGARALTQKNENLLERIIASTSEEGDLVMDFFAGTGTTCAVAQKMGRRWIGIEQGEWFDSFLLPRMKRVLAGDPYGISAKHGWRGGGAFRYFTSGRIAL